MGGEWKSVRFSDAVWVNPPVTLKRGGNYPFVEMQDVNPSERAARSKRNRPFMGGGARFAAGDTLMARITPCLENGKTARFASENDEAIAHGSTEFIVIRGRPGISDTDFAYYLTRWREVQDFAIAQMTGTSGRQRVPTEALSHLTIPLPPLSEQEAIADILGSLDDKIELNRKTNETLDAMARAIFKSWFVDFDPVVAKSKGRQPDLSAVPGTAQAGGMDAETARLFPSSFVDSEIGQVPKGWKVGTFGDVASSRREITDVGDFPADTAYIGLEHMPRRSIALSEWGDASTVESAKSRFRKNDILFGKLRPYFHKVGIAPVDGVCSTDILVIVPQMAEWSAFVLGHASSDELVDFADGCSTGTRMPRVSWGDLSRYQLAIPPSVLAGQLTDILAPVFTVIVANIHECRSLTLARDALLPRLLSGELAVPASRVA